MFFVIIERDVATAMGILRNFECEFYNDQSRLVCIVQ